MQQHRRSRRKNIRKELGLAEGSRETWEGTDVKVKEMFAQEVIAIE